MAKKCDLTLGPCSTHILAAQYKIGLGWHARRTYLPCRNLVQYEIVEWNHKYNIMWSLNIRSVA